MLLLAPERTDPRTDRIRSDSKESRKLLQTRDGAPIDTVVAEALAANPEKARPAMPDMGGMGGMPGRM
ncbi:MAG: hypothetical protein ACYTHK_08480 [Planctomycetota bacterium]